MSVLAPVRSVARRSVVHVLGVQRRVTALQLATARLAERQMTAGFELYRVGLEAGLRFSEAAVSVVAGPEAESAAGARGEG